MQFRDDSGISNFRVIAQRLFWRNFPVMHNQSGGNAEMSMHIVSSKSEANPIKSAVSNT